MARRMASPTRINVSAKIAYGATCSNDPADEGGPAAQPLKATPSEAAAANAYNSQQSGMAKVIE